MKTITNKETKIKSSTGPDEKFLTRNDLLKIVTNDPPERGCLISEMRSRLKILSAIEKSDGEKLVLEDADFEILKKAYNSFEWQVLHNDIVDLADHLEEVAKQKEEK